MKSQSASTLNVIERGAGRPLLFVHGWPTTSRAWKHQLEGLSGDHHVLAVDLPGFGESPPLERPSIAGLAGAVRDFIDGRGRSGVFLIGWSLGAGVVMSYCQHFGSHRLAAVGIVDDCPKLLPDEGWELGVDATLSREGVEEWRRRFESGNRCSFLAEVAAMQFKDPVKHAADVDLLLEESLKADSHTALATILDVVELDFRESLRRVDVPALLLYGEHSTLTTPANREFMERTIPKAKLVVFHESSHIPHLEEPEKFNREVRDFAGSL